MNSSSSSKVKPKWEGELVNWSRCDIDAHGPFSGRLGNYFTGAVYRDLADMLAREDYYVLTLFSSRWRARKS